MRGLALDRENDRVIVRITTCQREVRCDTVHQRYALIRDIRSPIEQAADVAFLMAGDRHAPAKQRACVLHSDVRNTKAPGPLHAFPVKRGQQLVWPEGADEGRRTRCDRLGRAIAEQRAPTHRHTIAGAEIRAAVSGGRDKADGCSIRMLELNLHIAIPLMIDAE